MDDLIDYYRRGWPCIDYNDECRDRSSGCPCTETAEALEAQQAVIDAARDILLKFDEGRCINTIFSYITVKRLRRTLAKLRKSDE